LAQLAFRRYLKLLTGLERETVRIHRQVDRLNPEINGRA
jgi:hypothetical protein